MALAQVIALPTAAAEPVVRRSYRGRYPKNGSIVPIWRLRIERQSRGARQGASIKDRQEMEALKHRLDGIEWHLQRDCVSPGWLQPDEIVYLAASAHRLRERIKAMEVLATASPISGRKARGAAMGVI